MKKRNEQNGRKTLYKSTVCNIKALAAKNGDSNSVSEISRRVGIPQSTLNNKMLHPQLFTLSDLYEIAYTYEGSVSELTQIR